MAHRLSDIAAALGTEVLGDAGIEVTGVAEPAEAGPDQLAMAMTPRWGEDLPKGRARAAVVWPGADWQALGLQAAIVAPRPRVALAGVTALMDRPHEFGEGIHPTAVIDPTAEIGEGAAIGPFTVIGPRTRIGAGARIASHVAIGPDCRIGAGATLFPGAVLVRNVTAGERLVLKPNAVVGADGFSYVTAEKSGVEAARESGGRSAEAAAGGWLKIRSLGGVELGDDVEVGASSTIDAGTVRATRVGRGTKLDNQVQIGHNARIGPDNLFCGGSGVAGSVVTGARCVFGAGSGVADNITVGDDVIVAGGGAVRSRAKSGSVLMGDPAVAMPTQMEIIRNLRRLPRMAAALRALQERLSNRGESG